ncbi:rhoGEF domain-containing protein [Phthorimaea operculella]|nr:rhoGEF domain-containing protein [Phthorimaea operculella]
MTTGAPPRVSRNVSLPAGSQPPAAVSMLSRRTMSESDLEPGAATAPSGSSSSSSLSSRSNESNTVPDQHASASDWSDEEEPLAAQWADSLPPRALDSLTLSCRLRKRQEVIHELIVSEGSHVRWLKVLGKVFLRPLEAQPALLPAEELRSLFPNLPGVRERHSKLYADLRGLRSSSTNHYVNIAPVAEALLNTLGDTGYAPCLARFCRGQRMALDSLKERRRKNKELHQFLISREQMPLCGRLQLRDLLACVWQRLTKYQLLLEGILKTIDEDPTDGAEPDTAEDQVILKRALDVAKDVLHTVDTAIRTAENEHRLKTIQSKLEIRIPSSGAEWEEPRRLDLTTKTLRMEGELNIRNDSNKKMTVLALMLQDCLVLLQKESDKFILKPITQPNQQGLLSPLIKWGGVLFRPNAAVRNAFFLMNINGVQMHELSCNTNADYHSWVKHMEDLPLAKPELKPTLTPSHQPSRSTDDSGINVSRNPSDASEKSTSSAPEDTELERDRHSADRALERDRASLERQEDDKKVVEKEETQPKEETSEREDKHKPRRPTVGRISTHGTEPTPALLEPSVALTIQEPAANYIAHTAERVVTHHERLRRLDEGITRALRAKSAVVADLLGIAPENFDQMAELAIADTLGQMDVMGELRAANLSRQASMEDELKHAPPDMHQLLLAAQAQANQLTEALTKALTVNEAGAVAARSRGRCDSCRKHRGRSHTRDTSGMYYFQRSD